MTSTETPPTTTVSDRDGGPADGDAAERARERPGAAPVAGSPSPPRRFAWWLAGIVAAGLAVRFLYLFGWRNPWTVLGDPYYYHHGANLLADGEGYIHPFRWLLEGRRMPGADHPPGYLTVLAGSSWLGLRSFLAHQVVSCLLGGLGILAMGLAGRRIAGERVGLIVAAMTALSPNVFIFDAQVVSETLVVSTTALVLLAAYRWWDRPTAATAVLFGASIGVAALVRSEAILLGPVIAVPLVWWRHRRDRAGDGAPGRGLLVQLGAAALVAAVVIAPWAGYNMARFERPTTLSAQFDQTLGTANCDEVYHGDRVGYWALSCIQETEPLVGDGDASAQGRGFARIARQYMRDHAGRVPFVVAARVGRTFGLYQPQEQIFVDAEVESKETVLGQAGLFTWYAVAAAGAVGLVGLRRAGRPIFPLVGMVATVVVTVAVVYGTTRFRLPAELALMIPAAVSLDAAVISWWRRRRPGPEPGAEPAPVAVAAAADGEAEGHPASPAEDPAGGGTGPGAPAAGDTLAEVPGGLGSSSGRFAGFDGLRAVAALGVLVTHVALHVGFVVRDPRGHYLSRLDVGVAVFFVLSGFLLYRPFVARRMDGRPASGTRPYLRNRFLRIFPAYWLALTVLAVVLDVRDRNDFQSLGDFVTYYGLLQSYSADTALGGLQQAWTLTNEVAFYLLLPLWAAGGAWLWRRLAGRRAVAAELGILGLAAAGALAFRYWLHSFAGDDVTLGTFDPRLHWLPANFHLFVPGMALAVALEWSRRREAPLRLLEWPRRHPLLCWLGAAACFWAVSTQLGLGFEVGATEPVQGVVKELLYGGVGFLLVLPVALAGATLPRSLRWLASRPMVALGIVSYGIYLWHEGVTDIYRDVFDVPLFTGSFPAALAVTLAGSLAAAAVSYVVIERPALALKDRHHRLFAEWRPVGLPADARAAA
jgi:peptidoglycan/LPS O-acetylase OafA/YrhL/4-amino-4-deoxy-L-arabinose transferase-like glycosyltransferase